MENSAAGFFGAIESHFGGSLASEEKGVKIGS